ncbi:hypothetical protein ABPG72_003151 [Tetrahymena utriculariae]
MDKRHNNFTKPKNQFVQKKNAGTFTHFVSVPLNNPQIKKQIRDLQDKIYNHLSDQQKKIVSPNNPDIFHITLSMLTLPRQELKVKASQSLLNLGKQLSDLHKDSVSVNLKNLGYFKKSNKKVPGKDEFDELSLIFLDIVPNELYEKLEQTCHLIIKEFIAQEIIHEDDLKSMNIFFKNSQYKPEKMHITLFRIREQQYKDDSGEYQYYNWRSVFQKYGNIDLGQVSVPHIDISTRFEYDEEKFYKPLIRLQLADEAEKKQKQNEQINNEESKQN